MRFGKDGFDTKNPNELVLPTFWVSKWFMYPFLTLTTITSIVYLGWLLGTISIGVIGTSYLLTAFIFNPRQIFLKHQRIVKETKQE